MRCTGTVWEGDSFAREFSDQALLEDQLLVTPNDETISLSSILGAESKTSRDCFEIRLPVSVKSNRDYYIYVLPDVFYYHK